MESILKLKARRLYPGPVMILLCHSSLAWAHKDMATCLGDAMAKVDEVMKLDDMSFLDVVRAFPEYSVAQCVETYGIIGGVPDYLNRWNGKKSIKENICNNICFRRQRISLEANCGSCLSMTRSWHRSHPDMKN